MRDVCEALNCSDPSAINFVWFRDNLVAQHTHFGAVPPVISKFYDRIQKQVCNTGQLADVDMNNDKTTSVMMGEM